MGGTGWCTHPKRQLSNDVRILVRKAELACRNSWGTDYWEAMDGADIEESDSSQSPSNDPSRQAPAPLQVSFEDEVTSVVNTDIHRAHTREDLNDRVVDQTSLGPDDQARKDNTEDRFDLLARGGRDSVSHARNRMLRRRTSQPDAIRADDQDTEDDAPEMKAQGSNFPPDDFIEEEAPSPEQIRTPDDVAPSDDVILSEGVTPTTPRSRRLRRGGEQAPRPKRQAVVETEPDLEPPDKVSVNTTATGGQDRFNSVPEISSNIDLSVFRHSPAPTTKTSRTSSMSASSGATSPVEEPFERAVRNAKAIKAAARMERDGRQKSDCRPRATAAHHGPTEPRTDMHAELRQSNADRSVRVQAPDHHDAAATYELERSGHERTGFSSPHVDDAGFPDQDEYDNEFDTNDEPLISSSQRSQRDDARVSWWRGLFQSRRKHDEIAEEAWDDEYGADIYEDESWIAASTEPGDDADDQHWDNRDVDEDRHAPRPESGFTDPSVDIERPIWHTGALDDDASVQHTRVASAPSPIPDYEPIDLHHEQGMSSFRDRLFVPANGNQSPHSDHDGQSSKRIPIALARKQASDQQMPVVSNGPRDDAQAQRQLHSAVGKLRTSRHDAVVPMLDPAELLDSPDGAGYDPGIDSGFDVRALVAERTELLDMTIQVSPDIPRECATCRSYRQSEQGERGWCTNNWAFTHRQMVNATDLACQSTIGCWWLPADEEVWLIDDGPERGATPRVDRLIAHLDPLKRAVGR